MLDERTGTHDAPPASNTDKEIPMGATLDKVKGKLMKAEGKMTDDKVRSAQGSAVETKGKVRGAVSRGVSKVKGKVAEARGRASMARGKAKRKGAAARRTP